MKERKEHQKQTAFHFSWIRLPELHALNLFKNRKIEKHVLQDHSGVVLERENGKIVGRIIAPASPWRRLKVYLNESRETCDLVQSSIDPKRNFSHRVAVPRGTDGSLYYSASRDFLFSTCSNPRVYYDTELQVALCEDHGQIAWTLIESVDRSEAQIYKFLSLWHRFVKNRERMDCCYEGVEREGFRQITHQTMQSIKSMWTTAGTFMPLAVLDPDSDLQEIRVVMRQCFPEIYHHYIDHPPEPIFFRRHPEKEFRVEVKFDFDSESNDFDQPILVRPTEDVRLTIPPETCKKWTSKRCFSFYSEIVGFLPEEARANNDDEAKVVEIKKDELKNGFEFWGDVAEVVQSLLIYQVELKEKLPPIIEVLDKFRDTGFDKAVLVR